MTNQEKKGRPNASIACDVSSQKNISVVYYTLNERSVPRNPRPPD